ncbi:SPFH domain-containing protein [Paraburkholderia silviterrae]|uniref:Protease modulator HflK n=1 Tax=Paraburkholderia silviterrae TaxID=2528715 RepID=A0A4R5M9Y6_9BURK|nr:SPFH domain-containing protein [Paraburkholderia silviterrae]TDG23365.1 protease modulator HflK [Paraburkholderia silviterrae]
MSTRENFPALGPGAQAVRLSFRFVAALAVLAALAWATSNVRRIPADSSAVVTRFGAYVKSQGAGLLVAWPRPFEAVRLVPGRERVLERRIVSLMRDPRAGAQLSMDSDALAGSGYVLTGDNGVVQVSATLFYRVADPYAYALQLDHLDAALERIVSASVAQTLAQRDLDAILVARPEMVAADQQMAARREALRGDLARAVQRDLDALAAAHAGLGIEVARVDVQASFPASATDAFNAVLSSMQNAERDIAQARTIAEKTRQGAQQNADRIVQDAQANAAERVAKAQSETSTIAQLEAALAQNHDPGLVARAYRDRVQAVLAKAKHVTTIDPNDASSLVLPGHAP